jgi:hypothetical protein
MIQLYIVLTSAGAYKSALSAEQGCPAAASLPSAAKKKGTPSSKTMARAPQAGSETSQIGTATVSDASPLKRWIHSISFTSQSHSGAMMHEGTERGARAWGSES